MRNAEPDGELAGPGKFAVEVVGVSRRQGVLAAAAARRERTGRTIAADAVLAPEDDNAHDANAVRVEIDGELCGYLSRDNARRYRAALDAAGNARAVVRCKARIIGGFDGGSFGVRLDLPPFG